MDEIEFLENERERIIREIETKANVASIHELNKIKGNLRFAKEYFDDGKITLIEYAMRIGAARSRLAEILQTCAQAIGKLFWDEYERLKQDGAITASAQKKIREESMR